MIIAQFQTPGYEYNNSLPNRTHTSQLKPQMVIDREKQL